MENFKTLEIKRRIIELTHQLYRDIWLKFANALIVAEAFTLILTVILRAFYNKEVLFIYVWIYAILMVVGSLMGRSAMKKAKKTNVELCKLIDSLGDDLSGNR